MTREVKTTAVRSSRPIKAQPKTARQNPDPAKKPAAKPLLLKRIQQEGDLGPLSKVARDKVSKQAQTSTAPQIKPSGKSTIKTVAQTIPGSQTTLDSIIQWRGPDHATDRRPNKNQLKGNAVRDPIPKAKKGLPDQERAAVLKYQQKMNAHSRRTGMPSAPDQETIQMCLQVGLVPEDAAQISVLMDAAGLDFDAESVVMISKHALLKTNGSGLTPLAAAAVFAKLVSRKTALKLQFCKSLASEASQWKMGLNEWQALAKTDPQSRLTVADLYLSGLTPTPHRINEEISLNRAAGGKANADMFRALGIRDAKLVTLICKSMAYGNIDLTPHTLQAFLFFRKISKTPIEALALTAASIGPLNILNDSTLNLLQQIPEKLRPVVVKHLQSEMGLTASALAQLNDPSALAILQPLSERALNFAFELMQIGINLNDASPKMVLDAMTGFKIGGSAESDAVSSLVSKGWSQLGACVHLKFANLKKAGIPDKELAIWMKIPCSAAEAKQWYRVGLSGDPRAKLASFASTYAKANIALNEKTFPYFDENISLIPLGSGSFNTVSKCTLTDPVTKRKKDYVFKPYKAPVPGQFKVGPVGAATGITEANAQPECRSICASLLSEKMHGHVTWTRMAIINGQLGTISEMVHDQVFLDESGGWETVLKKSAPGYKELRKFYLKRKDMDEAAFKQAIAGLCKILGVYSIIFEANPNTKGQPDPTIKISWSRSNQKIVKHHVDELKKLGTTLDEETYILNASDDHAGNKIASAGPDGKGPIVIKLIDQDQSLGELLHDGSNYPSDADQWMNVTKLSKPSVKGKGHTMSLTPAMAREIATGLLSEPEIKALVDRVTVMNAHMQTVPTMNGDKDWAKLSLDKLNEGFFFKVMKKPNERQLGRIY